MRLQGFQTHPDYTSANHTIYDGKILIVDDNPTNLHIIGKILRNQGYRQVHCTDRPEEVAGLYGEHRYDAICLDINMPTMDGLTVISTLRALFPEDYLPIIVITGADDKETKLQALGSGARDFISRPFDTNEVALRIRNMVETCMTQKQLRDYNTNLESRIDERTEQLYHSQVQLIESLGRAAEFKDTETGMHVVRMAKTAELIAREMGLGEKQSTLLLHASPMHDIGKIGIPDKILLKKGKLGGGDWEVMKSHTELGASIIGEGKTELLQLAAVIARTHHERWDGDGYPMGLKGEQIPLMTRIVSVCDVFDALCSERPYKEPWPVDEAIGHIEKESGKHFDPRVVEAFIRVLPQIFAIRERFPDHADPLNEDTDEKAVNSDKNSAIRNVRSRSPHSLAHPKMGHQLA